MIIVPFGNKYKGRSVEEMLENKSYCEWCLAQPWFRKNYPEICEIVLMNLGEPAETPEHNAMQVRFLEEKICLNVLFHSGWLAVTDPTKFVEDKIAEFNRRGIAQFEKSEIENLRKWLASGEPPSLKRNFEVNGWDVVIEGSICSSSYKVHLELKTSLGDEFPVVLRQMKKNSKRGHDSNGCLIYDKFTAVGAKLEDVKKIFHCEGFRVFSMADISAGETNH